MEFKPIEDIDGDLLHLSYRGVSAYCDSRFHNTVSIEIEMVTCDAVPCLYFDADQLRNIAKALSEAADFLEKKGE
jgi:hypothetical protein